MGRLERSLFFHYIYLMAEKGITEKNLEAWNDVFADIANVLLFDGKQIIKEEELENDTKDNMFKAL